jgi:hypothetical protein
MSYCAKDVAIADCLRSAVCKEQAREAPVRVLIIVQRIAASSAAANTARTILSAGDPVQRQTQACAWV